MLIDYNYNKHNDSPEKLAERIINQLEVEGKLNFPIDPFYLLHRFNINYKLLNFDDLEGLYIVPTSKEDPAVVGINRNRPITRQRFTAAHEICHHIKDKDMEMILCPIDGRKSSVERFADKFASEILMPSKYLKEEARKYLKDGFVSFDDALKISLYFGVSFQACIYALAYKLKYIEGSIESDVLRNRIKSYKPTDKIKEYNLDDKMLILTNQLINYYSFVEPEKENLVWYRFKNHYISNEEKLEGSNLEQNFIWEIIADLRINSQKSEYCKPSYKDIIETAGQVEIFDFILENKNNMYEDPLKLLHKKLYKYAPYPEDAGIYRNSNNVVKRSNVETTNYTIIYRDMYNVEVSIYSLIERIDSISIADFIENAVKIHHMITKIHPFQDGNGRTSRSLVNWLFYMKCLYPVYVDYNLKDKYYDALEQADNNNFDPLILFFINMIIDSDISLNSVKYTSSLN